MTGVSDEDLDEVAENIRILVREELETQHRLEGHPQAVADCPVCAAHGGGPRNGRPRR
jgi:hypothetical protein